MSWTRVFGVVSLLSTVAAAEESVDVAFKRNTLVLDRAANPRVFTLELGKVGEPPQRLAKAGCDTLVNASQVFPLARLTLTASSRYEFRFDSNGSDTWVHVELPNGACTSSANGGPVSVGAGEVKLWLTRSGAGQLLVRDLDLPLAFGDVVTMTFKPPQLSVTAETKTPNFKLRSLCGEPLGRPAFLLVLPDLPRWPDIAMVNRQGAVHLVGPLEKQFEKDAALCWSASRWSSFSFEPVKAGTYAVFPAGLELPEATSVVYSVGAFSAADPLAPTGVLPAEPTLEQRLAPSLYAYSLPAAMVAGKARLVVEALFAAAPRQLFVFANEERNGLRVDEPLLLLSLDGARAQIVRFDGSRVEVARSTLKTSLSGPVVTPELAKLEEPELPPKPGMERLFTELGLASEVMVPMQRPAHAAVLDKAKTLERCLDEYVRKNDPSRGTGFKYVDRKTGESSTSRAYKKGIGVCGFAKVEGEVRKLVRQVFLDRRTRQKPALDALLKKF